MSVASMVDLGMQRQHEIETPRAAAAAGGAAPAGAGAAGGAAPAGGGAAGGPAPAGGGGSGVDAALSKLTAFVPSEVVGLYVAGLGTLAPATSSGKWTIFGICALLIPVFMVLNFFTQNNPDRKNLPVWKWIVLLVFALVAFVAWAAALPATPFLEFSDKATVIAGFAVLVLAAVMYQAADALGLVPKS